MNPVDIDQRLRLSNKHVIHDRADESVHDHTPGDWHIYPTVTYRHNVKTNKWTLRSSDGEMHGIPNQIDFMSTLRYGGLGTNASLTKSQISQRRHLLERLYGIVGDPGKPRSGQSNLVLKQILDQLTPLLQRFTFPLSNANH